jgi:hypothetical protein
MDMREAIKSQYRAALEMLRLAIVGCPDWLWDDRQHKNRFWHVAYHALFYTHLYLQDREEDFVPWAKHREEHNFLGSLPWPPHREPQIGEPYTREELLEYCSLCAQQVEERVGVLDLEAESGFSWLRFGKLELQLYNMRHIQQHAGELMERLSARAGVDVDWVGRKARKEDS